MPELFPRLGPSACAIRLAEFDSLQPEELEPLAVHDHRLESRPGSGGTRVSRERLESIGRQITAVAKSFGYPDAVFSKSDFDAQLGNLLAHACNIPHSEALQSRVWSFLTLCVAPHVVSWRFSAHRSEEGTIPSGTKARFIGGNRNAFQRVWVRAVKLDDPEHEDRAWRVHGLPEDTLVQIFERPGLSADPRVALALADTALAAQEASPARKNFEQLHRDALKLFRARAAVVFIPALDDSGLRDLAARCWNGVI